MRSNATMLLAPHARSTAAALLRWAATWLCVLLLAQGLAAAHALGAGPLHRHQGHDASATRHAHRHDDAQRHHHAAHDPAAEPAPLDAALDAAALALTAAFALVAFGQARDPVRDARSHVRRATTPPAWRSFVPDPLLEPPRAA